MHCYCTQEATRDPTRFFQEEFDREDGTGTDKLCQDWVVAQALKNGLIVGTSLMVSVINTIAIMIFVAITYIEAHHSISDETYSSFTRITIMQFINIAVIIMLVNFNLDGLEGTYERDEEALFWKHVGIFDGAYADFTVQWYFNIGASICLTLVIAIISPHISYLMYPVFDACGRCWDRGCNSNLKKSPDKPPGVCDGVNTTFLLQSELQKYYTSP